MQVEDYACVPLLCPRQERLIIALNNADGAIDQIDSIFAKIFAYLIEEFLLCGWDWRFHRNRAITGENAFVQEILRVAVDSELEIAESKSIRNTLVERDSQIVHSPNFHHSLNLLSLYQAQLDGRNDSEKTVATVNQPK